MTLNLDQVGKSTDPLTFEYGWRDAVIYALGIGATTDELDYLYEVRGPKVMPTFAVVPSFSALVSALGTINADLRMVLHGEQEVTLHRPIPPKGKMTTVATVDGIYDKGKGALAVISSKSTDASGELLFENRSSIFIRGAGGFGGDRGPKAEDIAPPDGVAPTFEHVEATRPEQAILYRLSGDLNPLHIDPALASAVGFEAPILHGLCTFGYAGRAVLANCCGGDASKLRSISARFAGTVTPGDVLTTRGWETSPGEFVLEVSVGDRQVITHSRAVVAAE